MKTARQLSKTHLAEIVDRVQCLLWLDIDSDGEFWNPDKEWNTDIVDLIGETLTDFGLRPAQVVKRAIR